jgi:lipopolysaccharide transport system ATP-binding protein
MTTQAIHPAIKIEGISKKYHIGAKPGSGSLYDRIGRAMHHARGKAPDPHPIIWALKDVSFEVESGTVVGILGRNGSGKSTLMKIIARVTAPTEGEVETRGRIGAMLQAGAGFHPELTGRDNIRLSGAVLGMSREEVRDLEGAIIEFAGIDAFLDTPVKFYSSGMNMRLAFSVSAHLNADIMLIDEVLAVGDAPFQEKCHDRILELVKMGRTVLFVSHSMDSVESLCSAAVVLQSGVMRFHGDAQEGIAFYKHEILRKPRQ